MRKPRTDPRAHEQGSSPEHPGGGLGETRVHLSRLPDKERFAPPTTARQRHNSSANQKWINSLRLPGRVDTGFRRLVRLNVPWNQRGTAPTSPPANGAHPVPPPALLPGRHRHPDDRRLPSATRWSRSIARSRRQPQPTRSEARVQRHRTPPCRTRRSDPVGDVQRERDRACEHRQPARWPQHFEGAPTSARCLMPSRRPKVERSTAGATSGATHTGTLSRRPRLGTLPNPNKKGQPTTAAMIAVSARTTRSPAPRSSRPFIARHAVRPRRSCAQAPTCRSGAWTNW